MRADFDADAAGSPGIETWPPKVGKITATLERAAISTPPAPGAVAPTGGAGRRGPRLGAGDGGEERQRQGRRREAVCRTACSGPPV